MSTRSSLALVLATVLAVLLAAWALWSQPADGGPQRGTQLLFPALAAENTQVGAVEIDTPAYRMQLQRSGDTWLAQSHGDYPVRAPLATELVARIAAMHLLEAKTSRPDWYALVGVEDRDATSARSNLVRLAQAPDGLASADAMAVLVGKISTSLGSDPLGGTFIRLPGDEQSWLASGIVEIPAQLSAWFEQLFSIQGPEITRVSIAENGQTLFDATRKAGAPTYDLASGGPSDSIDQELLKRITQSLVSVTLEDVGPAAAVAITPADRVLNFETSTGIALRVQAGHRNDQPWLLFHAEPLPGSDGAALAAAINARTSGFAFRLASNRTLPLLSQVADLLAGQPAQSTPPDGAGQIITDPTQLGLPPNPR